MAVIKAVSSKAGIGQALDYLIEQQSQKIAELERHVKGCMRSRGYY